MEHSKEYYIVISALAGVVVILFGLVVKQFLWSNKATEKMTQALTNTNTAIENNTEALKEMKEMHKDATERILDSLPRKRG